MAIKWPVPQSGRTLCRLLYYGTLSSACAVVVGTVMSVLASFLAGPWWIIWIARFVVVGAIAEAVVGLVVARQIRRGYRPGKTWLFLVFPVRNPFLSFGGWAWGGYFERLLNNNEMREYFRHCEESRREEAREEATDGRPWEPGS